MVDDLASRRSPGSARDADAVNVTDFGAAAAQAAAGVETLVAPDAGLHYDHAKARVSVFRDEEHLDAGVTRRAQGRRDGVKTLFDPATELADAERAPPRGGTYDRGASRGLYAKPAGPGGAAER